MLTKQFRDENAKLKEELSSKLKSEVLSLTEAINQLRKDADLEVNSLNHSVETLCEKMNDRVNGNMSVIQKQIGRVSQEINTRTRTLGADLAEHITQTSNDVVSVSQEVGQLRDQISSKVTDEIKTVSDKVAECSNQILAEKESTSLRFQKVNQEIDLSKAGLASKQASENLSAGRVNMEQIQLAKIANASQSAITPSASVGSNNLIDQGSVSEVNICNNVSAYGDVTDAELSHVSNTAVVNTTSQMPVNQYS
jgi:hypothetical protein